MIFAQAPQPGDDSLKPTNDKVKLYINQKLHNSLGTGSWLVDHMRMTAVYYLCTSLSLLDTESSGPSLEKRDDIRDWVH